MFCSRVNDLDVFNLVIARFVQCALCGDASVLASAGARSVVSPNLLGAGSSQGESIAAVLYCSSLAAAIYEKTSPPYVHLCVLLRMPSFRLIWFSPVLPVR